MSPPLAPQVPAAKRGLSTTRARAEGEPKGCPLTIAAWVAASRAEQGLPPHVDDIAALRKVAAVITTKGETPEAFAPGARMTDNPPNPDDLGGWVSG